MNPSFRAALLGASLLCSVRAAGQPTPNPANPTPAPSGPPVTQPSASPATQLDAISVTATRSPRRLVDETGTVSVIDAQEIDRRNDQTPREAVRYEPGVSFGNQPARGGSTNYVIRGIGDNRVRVQIDGFRIPDFPGTNQGAGTYTRDFVDLENVKQIEIVRGAASALYGSDAIGGVVSYITKDPGDYLTTPGKNWYVSQKIAYDGIDSSINNTTTAAVRTGNIEAMVLYTRRDGHEIVANGGVDSNHQVSDGNDVLGKIVWHATDVDTVRLTGEYQRRGLSTELRTEQLTTRGAGGGPSTAVLASHGVDTTERYRGSVEYVHDAPVGFVDRIEVRGFYTGVDRTEHTDQARSSFTTVPVYNRFRSTDLTFKQDVFGGDVQLGSHFDLFGTSNRLTYGAQVEYSSSSRPRGRYERNLVTGVVTNLVAGEQFPNKNFPDSDTLLAGTYIQDEITAGRLTVIPALRVDFYHLSVSPDRLFANSNTRNFTIHNQTDAAVSPKLGAVYHLNDILTPFVQYAHGFRAPPYDNANFGFTNNAAFYEILPNGNLKPETSDGFEGGLRGSFPQGHSFSVAGFYNRYSNFIDTVVVGNSGGLTQFQYQNLNNVEIYGVEARGQYRFTDQVSVVGSTAYAHGENKDTGKPIDSVDPLRFIGGLRYDSGRGWGGEATATHAFRHSRVSTATFFKAPEYTTLDLTAYWDVGEHVSLNLVAYNLTNERYFSSQDVIGVASSNVTRGLYAQSGRTFGFNSTVRF